MRVGEIAKRSGISASRIRFYEARRLLPKADRHGNGYRDYPLSTVITLRFIEDAQALGFSLREIGAALPANGSMDGARDVILPALEQKLRDIDALIAKSNARRKQLIRLIAEQEQCFRSGVASGVKGSSI